MIRVCPKRDGECPHGMACPYVIDRYHCKPEPCAAVPVVAVKGLEVDRVALAAIEARS